MEYKSVWIRTLADVGGERLSTQQMSAALIVGRVFGIRKSGITFKVVFVCFFGVCVGDTVSCDITLGYINIM